MKCTLEITMTNSEGVLERILGRLRQRNFSIHSMNTNCSSDLSKVKATITVESQLTSISSIMKHLGKLYDVLHMDVLYTENTENITASKHTEPAVTAMIDKLTGEQNEVCLPV